MKSQFAISSLNKNNYGGKRYLSYAFTEQGTAILSSVLYSDKAINVSIRIMKVFIEMRNIMINNARTFDGLKPYKHMVGGII